MLEVIRREYDTKRCLCEYLVILIKVFNWNRFVLTEPLSGESEAECGFTSGSMGSNFNSLLGGRLPWSVLPFSLISSSPTGLFAKLG